MGEGSCGDELFLPVLRRARGVRSSRRSTLLSALLAIAGLLATLPASAQLAELVADSARPRSSVPPFLLVDETVDGRLLLRIQADRGPTFGTLNDLYFAASDGTPNGTEAELMPQGTALLTDRSPFYFETDDAIYRTDGTRSGTFRVVALDGRRRTAGSAARLGDELLVVLFDPDTGVEEFLVTDDENRTVRTFDVSARVSVADLEGAGDFAYFVASGLTGGQTLWVTDGTAAGTQPLEDGQFVKNCVAFEDSCFFLVTRSGGATELWVSQGSPANTRLVADLGPDNPLLMATTRFGPVVRILEPGFGRRPFLVDVDTGALDPLTEEVATRTVFLDTEDGLFFPGRNTDGFSLYFRAAGASETLDLGVICELCDQPELFASGETYLAYFRTTTQLFSTDLTVAGTREIATQVQSPRATSDGVLFETDAGIRQVKAGAPPELVATDETLGGGIRGFAELAGGVAVATTRGDGSFVLWLVEDGAPPQALLDSPPLGANVRFERILTSDTAVFFSQDVVRKLWSFDGSTTRELIREGVGGCQSMTGFLDVEGDRALITCDVAGESSVWSIDTVGNLEKLVDGQPAVDFERRLPRVRGEILLATENALYRSTGRAAGTSKIADLEIGRFARIASSGTEGLLAFRTPPFDFELYRTDLTPAGTRRFGEVSDVGFTIVATEDGTLWSEGRGMLLRVDPTGAAEFGPFVGNRENFRAWGDDVLVTSTEGAFTFNRNGQRTDLFDDRLDDFTEVAIVGDRAVFAVDESTLRFSRRDGSFTDVDLGEAREPRDLVNVGGLLYFVADEPATGREVWVSDGTQPGTRLVHDLWPGLLSSFPSDLAASGDRLFFAANDGIVGQELFSIDSSAAPCRESANSLCLNQGRFRVDTTWVDFDDNFGRGRAERLTDDTATFWFFDPANIELVVKVLDGTPINGNFWVFSGALSDVYYSITVTDSQTGESRRYLNPRRSFGSFGDVDALGGRLLGATEIEASSTTTVEQSATASRSCSAGTEALCLTENRFQVEIDWQTSQGTSGRGQALPITEDTGAFWFFDPDNVEVVVKVLDATGVNGRFWVFYGALSDVAYQVTVTDTVTGQVRVYRNESGNFGSVGDTAAF